MSMTGRDCVLAAINHEEPERLPVDFGGRHTTLHIQVHKELKRHLGIEGGEEIFRQYWLQTVEIDPRVNQRLGGDIAAFCTGAPDNWKLEVSEDRTFYDEWEAGYHMPEGSNYFDYCFHPLAKARSVQDIDDYSWPDPLNPGRFKGLRQAVKQCFEQGEKAIMLTVSPAGSWEHTWTLRGPEQALMDIIVNRDLYEEILDRTVNFQIAQWTRALEEVGEWVDVAALSDDLGTQNGPMMSPKLYRQLFKPRLTRLISAIRGMTRAKIYIHTDGSVYGFLPDLIDAGIEIINPVQKECRNMEPERLKKEFGDRLSFWGASVQTTHLEQNTPSEVAAEALSTIRTLAPGGGFVFAPIHNIQPGVPPENIVALLDTARRYGKYPIQS
ncbi:MAG: hypothetical protein EHM41_12745 [Chloroflexi bacterium]|nr:MAG: hypothetical protein EHM41_12745 [Chloroflexota bacterium]